MRPTITQERLKELFTYCPDKGEFYHKRDTSRGKIGTVAGYNCHGSTRMKADGLDLLARNLVCLYVHGEYPKASRHLNEDRLDIRFDNLKFYMYKKSPMQASVAQEAIARFRSGENIKRDGFAWNNVAF